MKVPPFSFLLILHILISVIFYLYISQAVLALYAARRTSGIVVNIGFHVTSVVPSELLFIPKIMLIDNGDV